MPCTVLDDGVELAIGPLLMQLVVFESGVTPLISVVRAIEDALDLIVSLLILVASSRVPGLRVFVCRNRVYHLVHVADKVSNSGQVVGAFGRLVLSTSSVSP